MTSVHVHGEVANVNRHRSGNLYFLLKDGRSQIHCVMLANAARRLNLSLCDGLQVLVRAAVRIYPERGCLQLQIMELAPDGLGQLYAALEQLKQRLSQDGLFDTARKRPLPFLPRRVALITSPQGAVLHDILTTLQRRNPAVELWLVPTAVQGAQAHEELIAALRLLYRYRHQVDCVIVARGGGSLEDLMPFNHEAFLRLLAKFPLPVVSAVGHETDVTLCDLVADLRAPTPTAAAELVAPPREELLGQLLACGQRMLRALGSRLEQHAAELRRAGNTLTGYPQRRLERERERLQVGSQRLYSALPHRLEREQHNLESLRIRLASFRPDRQMQGHEAEVARLKKALGQVMERRLEQQHTALKGLDTYLQALSPLRVLDRGYALCLDDHGRPVTRAAGRKAQERLEVRFLDGSLACRVEAGLPPSSPPTGDPVQTGPSHGLKSNQL